MQPPRRTHRCATCGHLLWASIDNDDSLDLDQLSVAEQLPHGAVKILVAIADVDAIVKKGSAIDDHARTNTTSVYTAAEIFPMLPEKLSTDLTSLADGKERLAIVIEMEVGADGAVGKSDIYRAVVVNRAKLAYNSVAAWLDGTAPAPAPVSAVPGLDENLRLAGSRRAGDEDTAASARRVDAGDYRGAARFRRRFVERSAGRPEKSRHRADRRLHDRRERRDGEIPRGRKAFRRCGGFCARPSDGRESSSWRRDWASVCRRVRMPGAAGVPRGAPPGRSRRTFRTCRCQWSSCWAAANTCSISRTSQWRDILGSRSRITRIRRRRTGAFPI